MKHIIAAIALLAATVPALAQTPPLTPTQDYRMWSAEQMIKHLVIRLGRMNAACNDPIGQTYLPKASEACEKAVMSLYPKLQIIREVAASGDERDPRLDHQRGTDAHRRLTPGSGPSSAGGAPAWAATSPVATPAA